MSGKTLHRLFVADCRRMSELADRSAHLVVTSPPYWQLKEYGGGPGEIGFGQNYEEYINSLNLVWSECIRVLHPGCRLCVNIGDQFARSAYYGRYKVIPIRAEIIRFCEAAGLDYMGAVIWRKVTSTHTTGGGTVMGSYPYPRNGILRLDYEFILLFKKPGRAPKPDREIKQAARLSAEEWSEFFSGHWNFPGERGAKHLAAFPEELPRRLIRMFTFSGETVLDPFAGSGTTALAAARLGRNSAGYEVNAQFVPTMQQRLAEANLAADLTVEHPERGPVAPESLIQDLPYKFIDMVGIAPSADPRRENYGSRVNRNSRPRETYHAVAEIVSTVELKLSGGKTVRLIGVQPVKEKERQAVEYLRELTAGKKVYLRVDPAQPEKDGVLPVYLYLANRTFVNARLIRQGVALADLKAQYLKKKLYLKLVRLLPE